MDEKYLPEFEAAGELRRVSVPRHRRVERIRPVRAAFFLFLLGFFLYCVSVTAEQMTADGGLLLAFSDFVISCGF